MPRRLIKTGLAEFEKDSFDIVLTDWNMPVMDGLTMLKEIRSRNADIPIIMMSARSTDLERILGLESGADDYLPKPFNPRELLARVRAVLRRHYQIPAALTSGQLFRFGPYCLDMRSRTLTRHAKPVVLTSGEMDLLHVFARAPNRVWHRDHLLDALKGHERTPYDRSIDVQIARLRSKIEDNSKQPKFILTVWGKGYKFCPGGDTD